MTKEEFLQQLKSIELDYISEYSNRTDYDLNDITVTDESDNLTYKISVDCEGNYVSGPITNYEFILQCFKNKWLVHTILAKRNVEILEYAKTKYDNVNFELCYFQFLNVSIRDKEGNNYLVSISFETGEITEEYYPKYVPTVPDTGSRISGVSKQEPFKF